MLRPILATGFSFLMFASATVVSGRSFAWEASIFKKCWEYQTAVSLEVAPVADLTSVYFLDNESRLQSVDITLGKKIWSSELGGNVVSNLLVMDDSILVVTSTRPDIANAPATTFIRSLSRQTGITEWRVEITPSPVVWLGSVNGNVLVIGSEGSISALTRAEGKLVWKIGLTSTVSSEPYFTDSGIILGTTKNEVVKISGLDGHTQVLWKSEHLPTAVLIDAGSRLIIGDERGTVSLISPDGNRAWGFKNGAQISSVSTYDSEYLAASYDNFVYKLSRGGNVEWKRRLSGRVGDKPLILGNTGVISIAGAGSIYVVDLKNGKISNRIEMGDEVSVRVAVSTGGRGFVVASPLGISYLGSDKCPGK